MYFQFNSEQEATVFLQENEGCSPVLGHYDVLFTTDSVLIEKMKVVAKEIECPK